MELQIGKIIAELRRASGKTQEQLAQYVGVSTAAVSKWETAQSYPDIALVPSIADFFEVSTDALFAHQLTSGESTLQKLREDIFPLLITGDHAKALPLLHAALEKWPNDFNLLSDTAHLTTAAGDYAPAETAADHYNRAITYFNRAIANAPEQIQATHIKHEIAFVYGHKLNELDRAIEILEEINAPGTFQTDIASFKRKKGDTQAAKQILQINLHNFAMNLYGLIGELADIYREEGNFTLAMDAQKIHAAFLSAFNQDKPNYTDQICAWSYMDVAKYAKLAAQSAPAEAENHEMWAALERAVYLAARFDAAPSFLQRDIKFMDAVPENSSTSTSSDNLACHGLLRQMREKHADLAQDPRYADLCSRLESAKRTKKEANIW
jgi:transcriptional regulator with XRE-family HTH domain